MPASDDIRQFTCEELQAVAGYFDRLEKLLSLRSDTDEADLREVISDLEKLESLVATSGPEDCLHRFQTFLANDARLDRLSALIAELQYEFNLFEVLGVQEAEHVHSNILAWLLDPRANHSLGSSFLETFLKRTIATAEDQGISTIPYDSLSQIDWSETEIRREWKFIDILILNRKENLVCAIENKINAEEGFDEDGRSQLTRYREILDSEFPPDFGRHCVFLTPRGLPSKNNEEQKFWVPENYSTIHQFLVETLRRIAETAKPDIYWSLKQYESTIRRNIVTETNKIAELAREIYLEHREAIELIYRHKPNYSAVIKQVLKEAVAQQENWLLDVEGSHHVRFQPRDWGKYDIQKTGRGWGKESPLLLFEFDCPDNPIRTKGPALTLGPGADDAVRQRLFEIARQNPKTFNLRQNKLHGGYMFLHDYNRNLLDESDLGVRWSDGTAKTKLMERVDYFAKHEFPLINEAIIECFEDLEAKILGNET